MYYLLALISAFDGFDSIGLGIAFAVVGSSALLKFIKSLSINISWKKMILINFVSILNYVASAVLAWVFGIIQGYMQLVGAVLDQLYGVNWYVYTPYGGVFASGKEYYPGFGCFHKRPEYKITMLI